MQDRHCRLSLKWVLFLLRAGALLLQHHQPGLGVLLPDGRAAVCVSLPFLCRFSAVLRPFGPGMALTTG